MRFDEAFQELVYNEQPVSRESWECDCLLYNNYTNEIEYHSENGISVWKPKHEDIIADDWIII